MITLHTTASVDDVYRIIHTDHHDPFSVLGAHVIVLDGKPCLAVRAFLPGAQEASVLPAVPEEGGEIPMEKVHHEGFFEVVLPGRETVFPYRLKKVMTDGRTEEFHDSYSFMPTLTDFDIHLFSAGDHHRIYEKLGAHYGEVNGVGGVQF